MRKTPAAQWLSLAHHRLIGRALRAEPDLVQEAVAVVGRWERSCRETPAFVTDWRALLAAPIRVIAQTIARRDQGSEGLRGASPFALIPSRILTRRQAHRLWGAAAFQATHILDRADYPDYARHLRMLGRKDRISRFNHPVNDAWIDRFVLALQADPDTVIIGHYGDDLLLDGAITVSLADRAGERFAEVGLSVVPAARRHGLGYHLLERALLWARNHAASRYYALFATNNEIMFRLARQHRMEVSADDDGMQGLVYIHPLTRVSVSEEVLEEQIGDWDYHLKAHRLAFTFVAGGGADPEMRTDLRRLVRLARSGRIDFIAAYIIAFRYVLVRCGYSAEDHTAWLAILRESLQPLVAKDPVLGCYVSGLPSREDRATSRYGVWRAALTH